MELSTYFRPLIKWWWLVVAAGLVAAVSSFVVTRRQPILYESSTTLVVGRTVYESNPNSGDFYLNQQLASFYADLAEREPVKRATMAALGMPWLPEYHVAALPNSLLIQIQVADTDPVRAQAVANELANQLIKQTPTNDPKGQERQKFIEDQLNTFEADILATQDEINKKQAELGGLTSAREIADAQSEINDLDQKLSSLRSDYAALLASSNRGAGNTLTVIEPADLPQGPVRSRTMMMVLLSTVVAAAVAVGAAYLIEYLDNTLKDPDEITRLLGLPVIGFIAEAGKGKKLDVYVMNQPRSVIAEAFRSLRTDLEFSGVDRLQKTICVTSSEVEVGKTSIATNLAIVIAQTGKRVVLIDADLRRPKVHGYLGISNERGLSDVLRGGVDIDDATITWEEGNISVLTSGTPAPNPAELLSSKQMDQALENLKKVADVLVLDCPPFLVTDAAIIAAKADGVLLVVRHGYSRKDAAKMAVKQLKRAEARTIGVVLNRIPRNVEGYYTGYYNYSAYYGDEGGEEAALQPDSAKSKVKPLNHFPPSIQSQIQGGLKVESANTLSTLRRKQRSKSSIELFSAVTSELAVDLDQCELLRRILKLALDNLNATSGSILMLNETGGVVESALVYNGELLTDSGRQLSEVFEHGLAGWVAKNRQAVLVANTRKDPRWLPSSWEKESDQARSVLSIPLTANDHVIGVMTLVNSKADKFTEEDLSLLSAISVFISSVKDAV
jgi:succinoglycan biosynthesis transport protein ExoP